MMQANSATRATVTIPPNALTLSQNPTEQLAAGQEAEVLEFLAERPVHTVIMAGLIRDNGLVSPHNRGTFYAYRNLDGKLEGVALIGHATLMETRSERALKNLASTAQKCTAPHMLLGEREQILNFWAYFSQAGQELRLACRELMFELTWPVAVHQDVVGLRLATADELDMVVPVQAQMAFDESGIDPLEEDAKGFRGRCLRRIEQGRIWVLAENHRLIFKADVMSDTPEVIYLEGIWVNESERGNGYGVRCLSQLSRQLLSRTKSICLFVNERNESGQAFYRKSGYRFRSKYDTIFL